MQQIMDTIFRVAIVFGGIYIIAKCSDIAAKLVRSWLRAKRLRQIKRERVAGKHLRKT